LANGSPPKQARGIGAAGTVADKLSVHRFPEVRMIPRLLSSLLLLLLATVPAAAQSDTTRFERLWGGDYDGPRRVELSAAGGYGLSTAWSDLVALHLFDPHGGVHRQLLLRNAAVAPGASVGGALTYWRGRHGFRVHAGHMRSCLTTASRCGGATAAPGADGAALAIAEVPMDVWRYGAEGLVGLLGWEQSRFWRPYLVIGAGGVSYDPEPGAPPFLPGTFETLVAPPGSPPGTVLISDGTTSLLIGSSELGLEHVFGLTIGAGVDVRLPVGIGGAGLRLEVVDQITSSPFSVRVTRLDGGRRAFGYDDVTFHGRAIHNVRLMAGIFIELALPGPREEHNPWTRR
jgi:hypothetical protein